MRRPQELTAACTQPGVPFVDLALARRIELAEAESTAAYSRAQAEIDPSSGASALQVGSCWAVYAGPGSPVSRAIGLGMAGPVAGAHLAEVEGFFRARGTPVRVDLCPLADAGLGGLLGSRGYSITSHKQVLVMALPAVRDGTDAWEVAGDAGALISVPDPGEAELWVRTISQGFAGRDETAPADLRIARPSLRQELVTPLLAWVDGEPAGGGIVEVRAGLALLRSQSTRLAFRRRGVQATVVRACLGIAAAAGCDLAVVQTEPGTPSQRNLERLGFRVAYTKPTLTGRAGTQTEPRVFQTESRAFA